MLRSMTLWQFREWMAYYQVAGPLGDERADYRAASIVSTLVNLVRKKGAQPKPIEDFLLEFDDTTKTKVAPWQKMLAIGREVAAMANAPKKKR